MTAAVSIAQSGVNNVTMRNRIINGAMMIDQRNAGASVTPAGSGPAYLVDRFSYYNAQVSKLTYQQNYGNVTPPTGFKNYLGVYVASAATVGASDEFDLFQRIEGFNTADFGFGAAGASSVTLSFWVRSSLTGTFGGTLNNSGNSRSYPFTYTIGAANTWEQKSITVAGDTSGTWVGATNGTGLTVVFSMGAGSSLVGAAGSWSSTGYVGATGQVNLVATSGATFYITGVQLEKGTTATPFEQRLYGTELSLCQRYCVVYGGSNPYNKIAYGGISTSSTLVIGYSSFPVTMRTAPSFTSTGSFQASNGLAAQAITNLVIVGNQTSTTVGMLNATTSAATALLPYWVEAANSSTALGIYSAEL